MTKQIRVSEEYRAFLEAEQARFRTSFIKIVPTIGVPVLLFFSYGDWLIARDHYLFFLKLRLAVACVCGLTCLMAFKQRPTAKSYWLLLALAFTSSLMIATQSIALGGYQSVYYFGVHIVMGMLSSFFQVPPAISVALIILVYSTYVPVVLYSGSVVDSNFIIFQGLFCLSFGAIAFNSNLYTWRLRLQEFQSRMQLENDHLQSEIQLRRLNALLDISRQAAHDIRSPLTALDAIAKNLSGLSEEHKKLFLTVASRFNGISEHLLRSSRSLAQEVGDNQSFSMTFLELIDLCKGLLLEKQLLKTKLNFQAKFPNAFPQSASFQAQPIELGAILSNLINNSAEASREGQNIYFSVAVEEKSFFIELSDEGSGIPTDIQMQLLHRPVTFGKENGNGLGLYSANRIIKRWGGDFKIISDGRKGTTIQIRLPAISAS